MNLSIVAPCFNEQANISTFYNGVLKELNKMSVDFVFIFVDDGSVDNTFNEILGLSLNNESIRYIRFSRSFGKEAAMLAGLEASQGDYVVVMDVDLQDLPALIPQMYDLIKTGEYDRIATRRADRKGEPVIRSFFLRMFYKVINKISDVKIVDGSFHIQAFTPLLIDSKDIFPADSFNSKVVNVINNELENTTPSFLVVRSVYSRKYIEDFLNNETNCNYSLVLETFLSVSDDKSHYFYKIERNSN